MGGGQGHRDARVSGLIARRAAYRPSVRPRVNAMPYMTRIIAINTAFVVLAGCLGGCGIASGDERTTLTVLASSSLTEAFQELGTAYHAARGEVSVRFDFAGSLEVASDVAERRSADVLATADGASMTTVATKVLRPRAFAYDSMTIAVAPGDPMGIQGLADLADPRIRVVMGGPNTPVGRYATQVLANAGVAVRPRSQQADARTVLTRVRTGMADAGVVYATDVTAAGVSAGSVPIPAPQNVTVSFYAAVVRAGGQVTAAKAFVAWLGSPDAKGILRKYGFTAP